MQNINKDYINHNYYNENYNNMSNNNTDFLDNNKYIITKQY
jgi:hypothetical protein